MCPLALGTSIFYHKTIECQVLFQKNSQSVLPLFTYRSFLCAILCLKGEPKMSDMKDPCILLFITDPATCIEYIQKAVHIAAEQQLPLEVFAVLKNPYPTPHTAERLQIVYDVCAKHHLPLTVLFNDAPALTCAVTAVQQNVRQILISPSPQHPLLAEIINGILPECPLTIL